MIARKSLNPFSESGGSSSFEISEKSESQDFEIELKNFINENQTGCLERMKKIPALGIILGILSVFFQLGMFTHVKILYNTTNVTAFEMIYVRGISDLIVTFVICKLWKVDFMGIETEGRNAIRMRMFFAAASAFFAFLTLKMNPISIATTLTFTSPIFVSIFTYLAIGEKLSKFDLVNIFSWIIGVWLISNPFGDIEKENTTVLGIIIGVLSAVTVAGSFTMVRVVSLNSHFLVPMFYYWLATTAFAPVAYLFKLFSGHKPTEFTGGQFVRIIVLWIFGFISQFFLSASYKVEKAGRVSTVRYLQVVLSFFVDVFIFNTSFSVQEVIGAFFIVVGNFLIVVLKWTGRIS